MKSLRDRKREKALGEEYSKQQRRNHLKRKFGISVDEYNKILQEQNNRCAICGADQEDLDKTLSVDHSHSTGKNRGLLCNACNMGIGQFKDNPDVLRKAIEYLEENDGVPTE